MADEDGVAVGLTAAISAAVSEWCAQRGGGIVTSFVFCGEFIDTDGDNCLLVSDAENQLPVRSLGLAAYLDEVYRDEARRQSVPVFYPDDEED